MSNLNTASAMPSEGPTNEPSNRSPASSIPTHFDESSSTIIISGHEDKSAVSTLKTYLLTILNSPQPKTSKLPAHLALQTTNGPGSYINQVTKRACELGINRLSIVSPIAGDYATPPPIIGFYTRMCKVCNKKHPIPDDDLADLEAFDMHRFACTIPKSAKPLVKDSHTVNERPCSQCAEDGVEGGQCVGSPPCVSCQGKGLSGVECQGEGNSFVSAVSVVTGIVGDTSLTEEGGEWLRI